MQKSAEMKRRAATGSKRSSNIRLFGKLNCHTVKPETIDAQTPIGVPLTPVASSPMGSESLDQPTTKDCCKCLLPVEPEEIGSLSKASKQMIHASCVNSYKSMVKKSKKDAKYAAWVKDMSDDEIAQYYADRYRASKGSKRFQKLILTGHGSSHKTTE